MMKKILPILLCYVLMTSQVFAISGGPTFGSGTFSPVGTYSGVMIAGTVDANGINNLFDTPPSALGLFSISVPGDKVATGAFLLFENSGIFTGNFDASVDPDSGQLAGVAFAYDYQQVLGSTTSGAAVSITQEEGYAVGSVIAKLQNARSGGNSTARIKGQAQLTTHYLDRSFPDSKQVFTVSGYRQTTVASTITTLPTVITVNQ